MSFNELEQIEQDGCHLPIGLLVVFLHEFKLLLNVGRQQISILKRQFYVLTVDVDKWVISVHNVLVDFFTSILESFNPLNDDTQHLWSLDLDTCFLNLCIAVLLKIV